MSDTEKESITEDLNKTPPRKRKIAMTGMTKTFQDNWCEDFPWVVKVPNNSQKARCKLCNKIICAGKSELQKHQGTQLHEKASKTFRHQSTITACLKNSVEDTYKNQVKFAEIKLALYFAEHNVAIQNIDHLTDLLKLIAPDSKIIQDINLKRTKCTEILKNVLCETEIRNLTRHLQQTNFSIMVDESTDIGVNKNLCILVRYQGTDERIQTRLLELVQLNTANCTAELLYNAFKVCFQEKKIPLTNIVGMASDGCNTMIGSKNSFYTHLKEDVPNLLLIPCICHSSAIIANKACEQLPRSAEELMRSTYNYVSGSSKRCKQLIEMQEYFRVEQHKILNVSGTRWLSRHQCVVRFLENYEVLKQYFRMAVLEDKLKSAEQILVELNNVCNKAYLFFMKYALNYFNSLNALFQSRDIKIHILYEKCNELLKQICQNFLKLEIVLEKDLTTINVENPSFFLPLEKVFLSVECETLVTSMPSEAAHEFRIKCLNFYLKAVGEIQKRLPVRMELYKEMQFLNPSVAFSNPTFTLSVLPAYFQQFIDMNQIEVEWRNLKLVYHEGLLNEPNIESVWQQIRKFRGIDEKPAYANLCKLASLVMILPHSNAEAERIFSIVNDVKIKKRNRLGGEVLNSICVVRSALQDNGSNCCQFPVTDTHLTLHNVDMYSFKKKMKL